MELSHFGVHAGAHELEEVTPLGSDATVIRAGLVRTDLLRRDMTPEEAVLGVGGGDLTVGLTL